MLIFLFSYICSPHQLFLQVVYERVSLITDNQLLVACFSYSNRCGFVAAFVAAVYGDEVVVTTAIDFDTDGGVIADDQRTGTEAVWCNRG